MTKSYLSRKEVCELLKISLPTLDKLCKESFFKRIIIGGQVRFDQDQVLEAINKSQEAA
jgi:excisionase family DNA binding protein